MLCVQFQEDSCCDSCVGFKIWGSTKTGDLANCSVLHDCVFAKACSVLSMLTVPSTSSTIMCNLQDQYLSAALQIQEVHADATFDGVHNLWSSWLYCWLIASLRVGWVALKDQACASGLIRWSLAYALVAKKTLRTERVRLACQRSTSLHSLPFVCIANFCSQDLQATTWYTNITGFACLQYYVDCKCVSHKHQSSHQLHLYRALLGQKSHDVLVDLGYGKCNFDLASICRSTNKINL